MDLTIPAILMVFITPSGPGTLNMKQNIEFPTMELCMKSVENSKLELPGGAESEGAALLICVPKIKSD